MPTSEKTPGFRREHWRMTVSSSCRRYSASPACKCCAVAIRASWCRPSGNLQCWYSMMTNPLSREISKRLPSKIEIRCPTPSTLKACHWYSPWMRPTNSSKDMAQFAIWTCRCSGRPGNLSAFASLSLQNLSKQKPLSLHWMALGLRPGQCGMTARRCVSYLRRSGCNSVLSTSPTSHPLPPRSPSPQLHLKLDALGCQRCEEVAW
mmetsp:Transcript_48192/g.112760  ORF Transcript_48192/g.112760 Transcript_48192/m.112760 type:complete len:206 (+) Transcript_48192:280-897(+)